MFWLRNKKIKFLLRTLDNLSPVKLDKFSSPVAKKIALGQSFLIFRFTDPTEPNFRKLKKNKCTFFQVYFS